ncbi:hypothetical protein EV126DRAFT_405663, partial [Verticillium dahliae]
MFGQTHQTQAVRRAKLPLALAFLALRAWMPACQSLDEGETADLAVWGKTSSLRPVTRGMERQRIAGGPLVALFCIGAWKLASAAAQGQSCSRRLEAEPNQTKRSDRRRGGWTALMHTGGLGLARPDCASACGFSWRRTGPLIAARRFGASIFFFFF